MAGDVRTTSCDVRHPHSLGVGHVAQDGENGETRVEAGQTVDDGNDDGIPGNTESGKVSKNHKRVFNQLCMNTNKQNRTELN